MKKKPTNAPPSKRMMENEVRAKVYDLIRKPLADEYGDVLVVPTIKGGSKNDYSFACPIVFRDGTEGYVRVTAVIARKDRATGADYDGYAEAEAYSALTNK